jgi:hypothetical protein
MIRIAFTWLLALPRFGNDLKNARLRKCQKNPATGMVR